MTAELLSQELPEQPNIIVAANMGEADRQSFAALAQQRADVTPVFFDGDINDADALKRLLGDAHHVVILSDENEEPDRADALNILYYMKITDIKRTEELGFSVTLELRGEKNLQLLGRDQETDFIVAPHIVSMFLAQLADRPEVVSVFKELLSNTGSEIHLKPSSVLGVTGVLPCGEIRARLLAQEMLFLGYLWEKDAVMNPALTATITVDAAMKLIVISEK